MTKTESITIIPCYVCGKGQKAEDMITYKEYKKEYFLCSVVCLKVFRSEHP